MKTGRIWQPIAIVVIWTFIAIAFLLYFISLSNDGGGLNFAPLAVIVLVITLLLFFIIFFPALIKKKLWSFYVISIINVVITGFLINALISDYKPSILPDVLSLPCNYNASCSNFAMTIVTYLYNDWPIILTAVLLIIAAFLAVQTIQILAEKKKQNAGLSQSKIPLT